MDQYDRYDERQNPNAVHYVHVIKRGDQDLQTPYDQFRYGMIWNFRVTDVDGDGMADVIYKSQASSGVNPNIHALFGQSSGALSSDVILNQDPMFQSFQMADVNGDGFPDIVYVDSSGTICVRLNKGGRAGFYDAVSWGARVFPYLDESEFQLADLNGDGLADFIYVTSSGQSGGREFRVCLSTGSSFYGDTSWGNMAGGFYVDNISSTHPKLNHFYLADVNGDGFLDAIYLSSSGEVRALLNTGAGFKPDTAITAPISKPLRKIWLNLGVGDLNGDGLADFMYDAEMSPNRLLGFVSVGQFPDLLSKITTPMGGLHYLEYKPSTDPTQCAQTTLPYVVQTLAAITSNDGLGNDTSRSRTEITYSGGVHDRLGKQFRGFSYVRQQMQNNEVIENYYYNSLNPVDKNKLGLLKSKRSAKAIFRRELMCAMIFSKTEEVISGIQKSYRIRREEPPLAGACWRLEAWRAHANRILSPKPTRPQKISLLEKEIPA